MCEINAVYSQCMCSKFVRFQCVSFQCVCAQCVYSQCVCSRCVCALNVCAKMFVFCIDLQRTFTSDVIGITSITGLHISTVPYKVSDGHAHYFCIRLSSRYLFIYIHLHAGCYRFSVGKPDMFTKMHQIDTQPECNHMPIKCTQPATGNHCMSSSAC